MQTPESSRLRPPGGLAVVLPCLLSFVLCACGVREPERYPAAAPTSIRIATSGDYAPFSIWPEQEDEPGGFDPELMRAWARDRGHRIEWVRFAWSGLLKDARAGRFDVAAGGITVRPDRSMVGTFSAPTARSSAVVLVRSPSLTLADLDSAERRIAVNRGGHLERVARSEFPRAVLLPTSPNEAVPVRLAAGEVDAVVTDSRESPVWRRDQPSWLQLGPLTHDRKAVFAAPGRADLVADFDAWLLGPLGRRAREELHRDVLGIDPLAAHASVAAAVLAAVDERLALMPAVARFKQAHGLPIEVPRREQSVLDAAWRSVSEAAANRGVAPPDETRVRAFYRAQIEAAKEIQRRVVARAPAAGAGAAPDLDSVLRPALIRIGDRMAQLIVLLADDVPEGLELREWHGLAESGLSDASIGAIRDALRALAPVQASPRRAGRIF